MNVIIYLRFGEGDKFGWSDIAAGTLEVLSRRRKVVRVDCEEEGSTGHKLEVVPPLAENEASWCLLNIPCALS